ncbi:aspartate-semialdehyde dehydrogenase [Rickettsiales bacterium]|nr:aspartate-semialdehyde dehydrogenase [Rickettsiales bacterium]
MKKYSLAIIGATGNVGREILNILAERNFPVRNIEVLASEKSKGKFLNFGKKKLKVKDLSGFDFTSTDIVLSSPGSEISKKYAPIAASQGAIVIDNTSFFRMNRNVPLIVPEVNGKDIINYKKKGIIANPNCSTIQMVMALKPLHDVFEIKRIVVSTYQSTSGAGKQAMDELFHQTLDVYKNKPLRQNIFTKRIAFNLIPHIDSFIEDGQTKEEEKMVKETKKILDKKISVFATCVRVPVFVGHGESINIETKKKINIEKAVELLEKSPGIKLIDKREDGGYITPDETAGENDVFISRVRIDKTVKNGLALWVVADNLRKGAALNSVQIAEELIKEYI